MIYKSDIEQRLVIEKKRSNYKTHFLDLFLRNTSKYNGEIRRNEILLWTSSNWSGIACPVYQLKFDSENRFIEITAETNPIGKIWIILFIAMIISIIILPLIEFGFEQGGGLSIFLLFVSLILSFLIRNVIKNENKIMTQELKDAIENIEREKYPNNFKNILELKKPEEKELTLKKNLVRLFIYPVSILLIYFCMIEILPNGNPLHGLFGIGVCGLYLVADILNIMKK